MIRFDTRDKKPKVYNIAVLSGIAVAVIGVLWLMEDTIPHYLISLVVTVYIGCVIGMLIDALIKQIRYNPYSYNTIYYMGFSLFLLSVFVTHLVLTVEMTQETNATVLGIQAISGHLLNSAKNYMLLSFPIIFVFSVLLFISNISLLRHEVRRFANVLGILLALLMVGGEVFLYFADYYVSGSITDVLIHEILTNLFASLYLYVECMLIGAAISMVMTARYKPDPDKDYILILGCSIRKDGTPTPLLRGRIDKALEFYRRQIELTGKAPILVPSGGQGSDETISESRCMCNYLLEQGVPQEHILMEDQSRNTYENMLFSKEKIREHSQGADVKLAFSTTNYHVFRSGMMGRRVKIRAQGIGSKTKWYFWPNASVREFVGLISNHRGKQAIIIGSMIAIYTGLAFLCYLYY